MSCPFHHPSSPPAKPQGEHPPKADADADADADAGEGEPIPHPPEKWLVGNIQELDPSFAVSSFWRLAEIYGPIFSLNLVSRKVVIVSNFELINEVCDDSRFEKFVSGPQESVRVFVKNGLFTSYGDEEEWGIAHRTLLPVFGPIHVRQMFSQMMDILSQMVFRWDRFGPDNRINCTDEFTRLAFDVIGLCAFNFRFNAFYGDDIPLFAKQMAETLVEAGKRSSRLSIENQLRFQSKNHMMDNIHAMWKVCDDIVAERKANPRPDVNDILNVMLHAKDPVTGKGFTDENIRYQMATFLVAGHDTSAGTLNFLWYNLLHHPKALQKCYAEVDAVLGDRPLELDDVPKLEYIEASIRETLRYLGPIPALTRHAKGGKTVLLGGKYKVGPSDAIIVNLKGLHHDPAVWGDDVDEFKPERFLDGGFERLPPNAWRPFGTGVRSCIGRYLAEQEITMAVALILQRFVIEAADPDYQLKVKPTLTIKPDGFFIKARRRPGKDHLFTFTSGPAPPTPQPATDKPDTNNSSGKPMAIYYGGNTGTCKSFGEDLETAAPNYGLAVPLQVQSLDDAVENLPRDRPVVIIASSFEGLPADNARNFVAWLEARAAAPGNSTLLNGVEYTVFGAGNRDWAATFHRVPRLIDGLLEQLGATRLFPAGFVDVGRDIVGPFEEWKAGLFARLREVGGVTAAVKTDEMRVDISHPDTPSKLAGEPVSEGLVLVNKVLAEQGAGPEKRQINVLLPPGVEYRSGDYLAVQPFNPRESVARVLNRFGLHPDDLATVTGTTKEHLKSPANSPVSVYELISTRVELATPASQRQVATLASLSQGADVERLGALASDDALYSKEVLGKRFSTIDLLEDFPSCALSFASYLDMLSPLAPRQYSISSSPLAQQAVPAASTTFSSTTTSPQDKASLTATLTYDVYSGPSLSHPSVHFRGVASSYLASLLPGSRLRCFVRGTNAAAKFRLPADPTAPVIMVAAGTGIAPMRAFIQDRAAIAAARPGGARAVLGPAFLYYGCRDHASDFLYADELAAWQAQGVVKVRVAFSRNPPPLSLGSDGDDEGQQYAHGHVDELLWRDRDVLRPLFRDHADARILVCGSAARLGRTTAETCLKIYQEAHPDQTRAQAEVWLQRQKEDRYVSDVFG
ncbi:cytochrome P450 [Lasiosphaeria miniovina]|uniref:Bifunctional cytochrome P450/NADPH--P450 reductase n=1 Tax=Lasiosphaeria miniovina TaxID=1954250 RepID=A0AA40BFW6_9PEZI|nr:cytochrome P450 [Lasiosphaeria miniovina]KAK0733497.1 cytochrome P450 [Lasiosphaeria miniovina]